MNKQLLLYFAIRECQIVGLFCNEFQFSCSDRTSVTRNLYWFCNKSPRKMSRFISSFLNKLRHKCFEMFWNMMQNDIGHQWKDNIRIHSICIRTVSLVMDNLYYWTVVLSKNFWEVTSMGGERTWDPNYTQGWIFWITIFYNLKIFTSRSI